MTKGAPGGLLLVDAPSCANWCYYAVSPRLGAKGRFRSATHRLIAFILKLLKDEEPAYAAVLFDGGSPLGSPPTAAELHEELPRIRRLLCVGGIPTLELSGHSVADLAAGLLEEGQGRGVPALLVSARLAFLQLVRPGVTLINPAREGLRFNPERVVKLFGVSPEKIPDWLALTGDTAERIPGAKGIGPKRAASLIQVYGSIEAILQAREDLTPALSKALGASPERIQEGKALALIKPSNFQGWDLKRLTRTQPDPEELTRQFSQAGLSDLLSELLPHLHLQKTSYEVVQNLEQLGAVAEELRSSKVFAIDTETTGLDVRRAGLVGISLAVKPGRAFYIPVGHSYPEAPRQLTLEEIRPVLGLLLQDSSRLKVGQNIKFDLAVLKNAGLDLAGPLFDTMVASFLIHPDRRSHSLDDLSLAYLGFRMIPFKELAGEKESLAYVEIERVAEYACEDADVALQLYERFEPQMKAEPLHRLFFEVEMPLVLALFGIEGEGLPIDRDRAQGLSQEVEGEIHRLQEELFESVGERFDLDSPKEIRRLLTDRLQLKGAHQTPGKQLAITQVSMAKLAEGQPVIQKLMAHQGAVRFLKDRLSKLAQGIDPRTGRFYLGVHQTALGTSKVRVSRFFDPGQTGGWDLALKGLVKAPSGRLLLEARYQGLAQSVKRFGGDDPEHFVRKLLVTAKREGKVRTLFLGRERSLPQLNSPNPVLRRAAEEEAVETVVEGSCAEILKLGLLKLQRRLDQEGCRSRVIFLLADGFLLELPEEEEGLVHQIVKQELERAVVTTPPWVVLIAVGPRWGKMEGS